jgi:hypothetical protein
MLVILPVGAFAQGLSAVGPINPTNGFPTYLTDANGTSVEIGLVGDGLTGLSTFVPPDPTNPFSVQIGFDTEAFYWLATSVMDVVGGGKALLVMAVECSFGGDFTPVDGEQFVFTRIRLRIDAPVDGTYTVTHPFGTKTFNVTAATRAINWTFDHGDYIPYLNNRIKTGPIGAFLTAVAPPPPVGFLGTPVAAQTVTGSPTGNNFFRIDGPAGSNLDGAGHDFIQSNQFFISAKLAVPAPPPPPPAAVPTATTPIAPIGAQANPPNPPTFTYTVSTNATGYDIEVTPGAVFHSLTTSFTPDLPLQTGRAYSWRVRGTNGATLGPWSAPVLFTLPALIIGPSTPLAPAATTPNQPNPPLFRWTAGANAVNYDVEIQLVGIFPVRASTTFTPPVAITTGVAHRWRVRGTNGPDAGPWSAFKSFTITKLAIPAPVLIGPRGVQPVGGPNPPLFSWNAATNAAAYDLEIIGDRIYPVAVGTAFTPPAPIARGVNKLWRVRGKNGIDVGAWSAQVLFRVP